MFQAMYLGLQLLTTSILSFRDTTVNNNVLSHIVAQNRYYSLV